MTPSGTSKVATWHSRCFAFTLQDVADMKKEITDEDLLALITDEVNQPPQLWALVDLQVRCSAQTKSAGSHVRGNDALMQHPGWKPSRSLHRNRICQCRRPATNLHSNTCTVQGSCHGQKGQHTSGVAMLTDARPALQPQQGKRSRPRQPVCS